MGSLLMLFILGMCVCGAGLVLGCLYVLAVRVRDETELHDLVCRAQLLRMKRARRIAMLDDLEVGEFDGGDVEIISDAA